jgi:PAS domain S-box-containing protein
MLAGAGDSNTMQKRFLHKDGHVVWGQLAVSATRAAGGTVQSIVGVLHDTAERRAAEQ